jgi:hypothetical protein
MKMLKTIFWIFVFSWNNAAAAQQNDTIYWSTSTRLHFTDFKGYPVSLSANDAVSSITIDFEYAQYEVSKKITRVKVFCYFNRPQSWLKKRDLHLLQHEQGHFDLGELFARKFRKELAASFQQKKWLLYEDVQALYLRIRTAYEQESRLYDEETDHSKDKFRQLQWNKKIREELNSLASFSE